MRFLNWTFSPADAQFLLLTYHFRSTHPEPHHAQAPRRASPAAYTLAESPIYLPILRWLFHFIFLGYIS